MKKIYFFSILFALPVFLLGKTEKYRLIINDDPATTMTIGWNQVSGHSVAIFYDEIDHGQDFSSYINFKLPDRTVKYKGMNNYFARLTDLKPATNYYFVIVDSEGVSQRFWFRTLSNDPNVPLSIIAGGDSRRSGSETTPHEPRIKSNKVVRAIRPDFVAFGGDYTDKDTDGQWQTWMDDWQYTRGADGLMIPILPTRGNHERNNEVMVNLFDVRQNDIYYAITFGGSLLRFYTLNVMISVAGNQSGWLRQDLQENDDQTAWKLAQYHYSIAPHHSGKSYQTPMYLHWSSLFHEFGVQLIIECDAHVAKNTWPIRPSSDPGHDHGFVRDDETGSVYAGEGSWGLIRNADVGYEWTREKGSFTQVKWIQVSLDSLMVYTIKSATSDPTETTTSDDRFRMPAGLDLWVTENGDHFVIDRPDPGYNPLTTSTRAPKLTAASFVEKLFPNPVNGALTIELKDARQTGYQVFNASGKEMMKGVFNSNRHTIQTSQLPGGTYFLRMWRQDDNTFQTERFIKE